jgi:hypothetical protein
MTIFENRTETLREKTPSVKTNRHAQVLGGVLIWSAATCRRFPTARHVASFQSADVSAHSKSEHCEVLNKLDFSSRLIILPRKSK